MCEEKNRKSQRPEQLLQPFWLPGPEEDQQRRHPQSPVGTSNVGPAPMTAPEGGPLIVSLEERVGQTGAARQPPVAAITLSNGRRLLVEQQAVLAALGIAPPLPW